MISLRILITAFACNVLLLVGLVAGQSNSRSFADTELNRIRNQATPPLNSISRLNRADVARGTAQAALQGTAQSSGISVQNFGFGPARAQAASFGNTSRGTTTKPFSGVTSRPTVSPYLGLFRENLDADTLNYNSIVQPLQQQQQLRQQVQRQQQQTNRMEQAQASQQGAVNLRLQQLSARPAFNPTGSQATPPTGHPTTFSNTMRFYPFGRR